MESQIPQAAAEEPIRIRKANDYAKELKDAKPPEMLFDEFWREGELGLLFGPSGAGKSILGVQVADALARGRAIDGFRMPDRGRRVLYVDMEMSDMQFVRRNSVIAAGSKSLKTHTFSERFCRESPPDVGKLAEWLKAAVKGNKCRVVVIDSLAAVRNTQDGVRETLKLMRDLRRLKDELDISILVLTDCLDARRSKTLTEADLGRNRVICSAADSVFALCRHRTHFDSRYIVQTRSRNAPLSWTEQNAPLCSIVKLETGLLAFRFDDRFLAKLDVDELELICNLKAARDEGGESIRSMAELFEITPSRAERLYKKWSPAIEAKYRALIATMPVDDESDQWSVEDDSGQWPVVSGQEGAVRSAGEEAESLAADGRGSTRTGPIEEEAEEWDEAGFERPVWLDEEANRRSEVDNGKAEIADSKSGGNVLPIHNSQLPIVNYSATPFAAALRRRSVYELKVSLDSYGREIFVEEECQVTGKPKIWYCFDRQGKLIKAERGRAGIKVTHLGPSPWL